MKDNIEKVLLKLSGVAGIFTSALLVGIFMYSNALDFTTDNTIGYIKEMFFTPDGESQLVTKETVNLDGGDSSVTLTGELNIIQGNIANSAIISQDIGNGTLTTNKFQNSAVTNTKVGNGAITTNKIKDGEVTGLKVGEEQVLPGKIDKTQDYKFQKLIAGSVSSKYIDPNGTSYVNSVNNEYTFFQNGISNNNVLIGTNVGGSEKLTVNGDIIATNQVCKGTYCLGNKPKEIGVLSEGKRCVVSGGIINCNISGISYDWTIGTWGGCTETCGGGTQSRAVTCKSSSGITVADSYCTSTKPGISQSCNTQACPKLISFYVAADNRGEMWNADSAGNKLSSLGGSWGTSGQYKIAHGPHTREFKVGVPEYFISEGYQEDDEGGPSFIFTNESASTFTVNVVKVYSGPSPTYRTNISWKYNTSLGSRGRLLFTTNNISWKWLISVTYNG